MRCLIGIASGVVVGVIVFKGNKKDKGEGTSVACGEKMLVGQEAIFDAKYNLAKL